MAPHQNKVFYDPERVLPANKDFDSRSTEKSRTRIETIRKTVRGNLLLTIKMV